MLAGLLCAATLSCWAVTENVVTVTNKSGDLIHFNLDGNPTTTFTDGAVVMHADASDNAMAALDAVNWTKIGEQSVADGVVNTGEVTVPCDLTVVSCVKKQQTDTETAEKKGLTFADPFVLYDDGLYYAYGTGSNTIPYATSTDLKTWELGGDALVHTDSYGDDWFWAPEVVKVADGRYLMFYTAKERVCIAESDSPRGPFKMVENTPFFPDVMNIDNSLFIDDDGTPYMYFDINDDDRFLRVCVVRLTPDMTDIEPGFEPVECIERSQDWEKEKVNEGSYVTKYGDTYYMTYSGNGYDNPRYGLGVATAKSPLGPWTKYEGNPIFQFPENEEVGRLEGVGHSSNFRDADGNLRITFHAHNRPGTVHPREMYISTVSFTDGDEPMMVISQEDMFKCVVKDSVHK